MPRSKKDATAKRKAAVRKTRAESKVKASNETTKAAKAAPKSRPQQTSAGANRAQGIALFKLAGRPSKQQFILVYGPNGPKMTWAERDAAGTPAAKFQAALAEKTGSRRMPTK